LRKWRDEKRSALTLVFDVFTSFEKRHNKSASQVYRDRHQKVTSFGCTYTRNVIDLVRKGGLGGRGADVMFKYRLSTMFVISPPCETLYR
jgi:hypothetical protein